MAVEMMGPTPGRPNPKANFFLVGAPKAGTTSVDRVLRSHPQVFLSPIKEPCYFCPDVNQQIVVELQKQKTLNLSTYLASPDRELTHLFLVSSADDYARLFDGADGHKVVGECSTFYLSSRTAPRNIHSYNPNAKIVVLLRNPLDRIRSHYAMDRSLGVTTRPLLALVEEELALGDDANWGNCRFYVGASRYSRQLREFHRHFAPDSVCVLSFEHLVAEPERELRRLFAFLDIEVPAGPLALPLENRSRAARFPALHQGLRDSGLKPLLARAWRSNVSTRLGKAARSVYYRKDPRLVSEHELKLVERLLREAGLECAETFVG